MADSMDLVQARVQQELERNLANVTGRPIVISKFFCLDCGVDIPEARRRAVKGVTRCVNCQQISELKSMHYKGSAV